MKQFSVYTPALLLVIGTTSALARGRDHRGHSNGHHNTHRYHHNYGHHNYRHSYNRHRGSSHYRQGFYRPGFYRPGFYGQSFLGAALIGSAFNYSLYHRHNGAVCYDNHVSGRHDDRRSGSDRYESRASSSEVVGCHRIERLPDGTERRVDVPRSQCE